MTKVVRFWKQITFWNKLRSVLTALGVGGEFALYMGDSHSGYKWVVGGATALAIIITHLMEDKNSNGVADIFEKDVKPKDEK
jgi:hypothetical protein